MRTCIDIIENCDFECEAGKIKDSSDWANLKKIVDLWIVVKQGKNIRHTSGNGGWRFTACTNKEEAQFLANLYNKEQYGGCEICTVRHLLDIEINRPLLQTDH